MKSDIARGLAVLEALGPFDVGQAAVVADGYVLAIEAAEGTDAMLARVAELRRAGPHPHAARRRRSGEGAEDADRIRASICRRSGPRTIEGVVAAPAWPASRSSPAAPSSPNRDRLDCRRPIRTACSWSACPGPTGELVRPGRTGSGGTAARLPRRGRGIGRPAGGGADARDRRARRRPVAFTGVGGHDMAAQGLASLFPIDDLAIIGFTAIPRRLPLILRHIRQTVDAVVTARPDVLVIIDSPDFTHRVARRVRARAAGYPDRRLRLALGLGLAAGARADDARLCRSRAGAAAVRAGGACAARRPAVHLCRPSADRAGGTAAPERRGGRAPRLPTRRSCWCFPAAGAARCSAISTCSARRWRASGRACGAIEVVLPTVPHLAERIREATAALAGAAAHRGRRRRRKWAAFRTARAALAASGTVTLELAIAGVPTVVAYKVSLVEEAIGAPVREGADHRAGQSGARRQRRCRNCCSGRRRRNGLRPTLAPLIDDDAGAATPARGVRTARCDHGDRVGVAKRARRRYRARSGARSARRSRPATETRSAAR